ncbi:MAG: arginine--tRNA ligase [Longilinea sp.]|nr:arginine--tRNA ligase [Longilinea sp.]MCA1954678.1 arginine--tRNA ligase [Anaerolinea sp.]
MFEREQQQVEQEIRALCAAWGLPQLDLQWSWIPFSGHWGISTSFFQLAAQAVRQSGQGGNVPARAQEIAAQVVAALGTPAGFERVEAVKGYLNLYFDTAEFSRRVLEEILTQGSAYGRAPRRGERVMIEFSHPNTHKAFHVGHLRGTILGDVIARLLDAAGYDVVRANYPGDMGLHVIKWLWCYLTYHAGERPGADITRWMGEIYADATRRLEADPELEKDVRQVYVRWDQRDPQLVALWQETRQWSLDGFAEMYAQLGVAFDCYYFNSQMELPGKQVVQQLIERGIAQDERPEGAVIVKIDEQLGLTKEKYRVAVVLRSDGTALYATEDLALALKKFADYPDLTRSLYLVDVRQSLHFQQIFKILELAGYPEGQRSEHISYELVNLPGNVVMSSREGTVVLLEDLLREATRRALEVVREKNPSLSEEQMLEVARAVGIGALRYPMLARENTKTVTFDWQSALDFNGRSAAYIQYAHVRANSILRKYAEQSQSAGLPEANFHYEMDEKEVELIDRMARLTETVQRAAAEYNPILLANLAYDLAQAFNNFYTVCPVLQAEEPARSARLRLVAAFRQTVANSLALLGITAPQAM